MTLRKSMFWIITLPVISVILGMILKLWTFMFAFFVYCPHFFYLLVCIISLQSKFSPRPLKKIPHREKITPFPTQPVFLTSDRTDPRFEQNMAPWPESGRGCTVRSWNPRRSGVPRSSLIPTPYHCFLVPFGSILIFPSLFFFSVFFFSPLQT